MRIASGSLKGRLFDAPAGFKTHPMSEQIRNALFNTLGDVGGLTILDAYSGSGAVAFEAVSRGASKVYAVEKDPRTFKTLSANRDKLALGDSVEVSRANCMSWLANQELLFDVIIADPPFDQVSTAHMTTLLEYLAPNGLMIISHPSAQEFTTLPAKFLQTNTYGNAQLSFFKKASE